MQEILDARARRPGNDFVFGRDEGRPFSGWGQAKDALDARIKAAGIELPAWRLHDLRRTVATGMSELGVAPHVVESALNHVSGFRAGVAGVYNHARYEGPVRVALAAWSEHVRAVVEGRVHGDRVVPLRRA